MPERFDPNRLVHSMNLRIPRGVGFLLGDVAVVSYAIQRNYDKTSFRPSLRITKPYSVGYAREDQLEGAQLLRKPRNGDLVRDYYMRISSAKGIKIYIGHDFALTVLEYTINFADFTLNSREHYTKVKAPQKTGFAELLMQVRSEQR